MQGAQPALCVGARELVVVAGLPGSGKTTLLRRLRAPGQARALDPEQVASRIARVSAGLPYRAYRPLVHALHWARVVGLGVTAPGVLLVHATGTRRWQRALLAALALLTRRPHRYVWLEVDPAIAYASTHERGRPHGPREFARHVRRLPSGPVDGVVVDRAWVNAGPHLVIDPESACGRDVGP